MQRRSQKVPVNTLRLAMAAGLEQMWEWKNGVINKAANPRTSAGYLPAINTRLSPSDFTCQWQEVEVLAGETAGSVSEQRRVISERLFRRVTGQSNPKWTALSASVHTWHKNVARHAPGVTHS